MVDSKIVDAPESARQIEEYMGRLRNALDRATEVRNELVVRLTPVLREEKPAETCNEAEQEELVPLAHEISGIAVMLNRVSETYEDVLKRLEL